MDDAGPSTPVSTPKGLSETSKKPPRRSSAVMRSSALHERSVQWKAKEPRNSLFRARKVPLENKMGVAPSGWMAEVGFALQRGIADAEAAVVAGERISQAAEWAYSAVRDGSSITCSSAEFSVVCAAEFAAVRRAVRVADAEFYADLGLPSGAGRTNLQCISKAMASGQSSAFFFISANYRFLIKTLCKADYASITRALPAYLRYMEEAHAAGRTTLLPLYLGAWSLRLGGGRPMRFIALNNFFAGQHVIYRRYYHTGSTHGSRASSAEVAKGRFAVYKDLDFRREQRQLHLGAQRAPTLESLRRDVELLQRLRLIDYSLLVGLHVKPSPAGLGSSSSLAAASASASGAGEAAAPHGELMNVMAVDEGSQITYLGIVDILTEWSFRKRLEHAVNGVLRGCRDISCQPPRRYGERFLAFADDYSTAQPPTDASLDELRRLAMAAAETTRASEASTGSLPLRRSSSTLSTGSLPSVEEQSEAVDGGGPVQRV